MKTLHQTESRTVCSGTLELAPGQRTFGDSTGVLVEASDEGDMAGPGLGGRARVADSPPSLLLDHAAQERRSVPPPLVRLEELVRPEAVRFTHQKHPQPNYTPNIVPKLNETGSEDQGTHRRGGRGAWRGPPRGGAARDPGRARWGT